MKNLKNILIIGLIGFTIYLCLRNYQLKSQINDIPKYLSGKTDTIRIREPFKPVPLYKFISPTQRIILWDNKGASITKEDTSTNHNTRHNLNLVQSSHRIDSLVQFTFDKDKLSISLFNKQADSYSTRLYNLDFEKYKYNWYEGQLTQKKIKRLNIHPYIYGKYRPLNNLYDIGGGISFKTKRYNYKLGINQFYYPKYHKGIKTDLEFIITYKF